MITQPDDFLLRCSKSALAVRHEDIIAAPGLMKTRCIYLSNQAETQYLKYLQERRAASASPPP